MNKKITFIYDGECPFCNHFAELLELKSGLRDISMLNARENISLMSDLYQQGYDIDKGAILLLGDEILHGGKAINWICSKINEPSDSLLRLLVFTFSSTSRTQLLFPFLIFARRLSLLIKGIPAKLLF